MRIGPRHRRGFALLAVLWTMALLALLASQIAATARSETRIATALLREARLREAADGAVHIAAFRLLDRSEAHWDAHSHVPPFHLQQTGIRLEIDVQDEAELIDLNTAPADLLQAALELVGLDSARAGELAGRIVAWRESATQPDTANGQRYLPPHSAFRSLDELGQVAGITPVLSRSLTPHLALHAGHGPTETTQERFAAAALHRLHQQTGYLPPPTVAGTPQVVRINVTAQSSDGARFTRHAIIRLSSLAAETPVEILEWN